MSERGSSDGDSNTSFLSGIKKSKRQMLAENGVEMWAIHHTVCLGASGLLALLCLGFVVFRFNDNMNKQRQQLEALKKAHVLHQEPPKELNWDSRFQVLGCYPLQNGDWVDAPNLRDLTCMKKNVMGVPCRSGLPFYRLAFTTQGGVRGPMSWRMCGAYCLFKGFDISGVVSSVECRCGATTANSGIWHQPNIEKDRLDLLWQPPWNEVPSNSSRCAILAVRYTGKVPIVGLSFDRTNEDVVYVRSIVRGKQVAKYDVDVPPDSAQQGKQTRLVLSQATGAPQQAWLQSSSVSRSGVRPPPRMLQLGASPQVREVLNPCYPAGQCASGLSWPIRTDFKRTGIPFAFSDSVDQVSRQVFLSVVKDLHAMTCISFNEVSPFYNQTYKIRVRGDLNGCFTNFLGYPGKGLRQDIELNLGWCKTELEKGNIIHELCHALGMGHEQTRPDRDAYVQIKWETLTSDVERKQYEVNPSAYIGSQSAGQAPYDYESIMHYPKTDSMMTKPVVNGVGAHDSQIGQRQQLSTGDVFQLRNMYRCDAESIECVDDDQGLEQYGPYEGPDGSPVTCEEMAVNNLCTGQFGQDVRYFCPKSCNDCPVLPPLPEVEGCQDVPGMEEVCDTYSDFCPGKVPGWEEWMTRRCRRTCFIERFCGTSTTVRVLTTTTAPTAPPNQRLVAFAMEFDIVGGGYDLQSPKQRVMLSKNLEARASDQFGTDAKVNIDPYAPNQAKSTVQLACGCAPSLRLPCSKSCSTLRHQMMSFTYQYDSLNKALSERGLSGVEVTGAYMVSTEDRIKAFFYNGWVLHSVCIIGGIAAAVTCLLLVYYNWIHQEHKDDANARDVSYSELSDMDPEK